MPIVHLQNSVSFFFTLIFVCSILEAHYECLLPYKPFKIKPKELLHPLGTGWKRQWQC